MLLRKLFLYFSQFVSRQAAEGIFVLGSDSDYEILRRQVAAVPDTYRQNDITDFIFGVNDQAVHSRISSVKGLFLFVDYSSVTSSINSVDVKSDNFHVAVTIARPTPENCDQATEMLWQDKALDAMSTIRRKMRDDFDDSGIFWLTFPTTMQPFVAHSLANSIGWTMEFDVHGIDMI